MNTMPKARRVRPEWVVVRAFAAAILVGVRGIRRGDLAANLSHGQKQCFKDKLLSFVFVAPAIKRCIARFCSQVHR